MPSRTDIPTTREKALRLNLDNSKYGTFAEIGAGQETAAWLFRVGGASGTVFGASGAANFLTTSTKWLAVAFFGISIGMGVYISHTSKPGVATDLGVVGDVPATTTAPASVIDVPAAAPVNPEVPAALAPAAADPSVPAAIDAAPATAVDVEEAAEKTDKP